MCCGRTDFSSISDSELGTPRLIKFGDSSLSQEVPFRSMTQRDKAVRPSYRGPIRSIKASVPEQIISLAQEEARSDLMRPGLSRPQY